MQRNTFQLILAMDTNNMKSFVSFRYEDIKWNSIRPAMMGIQAIKSNIAYNYLGKVYDLDKVSGNGTREYIVSYILNSFYLMQST